MTSKTIKVEVAYVGIGGQAIIPLEIPLGSTVLNAILQSKMQDKFREIIISEGQVGIFGELVPLSRQLKAGDRVEVYRKLLRDPKMARQERVQKARLAKARLKSQPRYLDSSK